MGTRVLQGVRAVDADQQGPYSTVQYSILPGPHSVSLCLHFIKSYLYIHIDTHTFEPDLCVYQGEEK